MHSIIIDDDQMSRVSLESICEKLENIEVVRSFDNGIDALNWLKSNRVDLIFLDIQMPDLTGIDIVKSVPNLPQIIFITGHTEFALEAFEYRVTDFLPKPVQVPRLMKALDRAEEIKSAGQDTKQQDEIYVRVDGRYIRLAFDDILYVESLGDYVTFVTNDKKYIVHSTLKNIDDKLGSDRFLKVHRSYIVNLSKIVDIEETNLVIKDKVIPISRANKPALMERIKPL